MGAVGITALTALFVLTAGFGLRRYWRARGVRLVDCPETGQPAAVHVAAASAALHGQAPWHLKDCTRWPDRHDCSQECLSQIAQAPHGCRVRELLEEWYRGRECVLCGRSFEKFSWAEHAPTLIDQRRRSVQCFDLPAERLPQLLETHQPICWDCHVVESLYRKHPDRITERPGRWKEPMTRSSAARTGPAKEFQDVRNGQTHDR